MTFDLYVWQSPRDLDADQAGVLLKEWLESGGDPGTSPFGPSSDVGWFYRELVKNAPELETLSDAVPSPTTTPMWLSATDEPPARLVAMRLAPTTPLDELDSIVGLAAKYDLVLYDARSRRIHLPLEAMAAHASATFWPAGAIQAAVAGAIGGAIAVVAWILAIPVLSGILVIVGGFLLVMSMYTFVHEGRKRVTARRVGPGLPPDG